MEDFGQPRAPPFQQTQGVQQDERNGEWRRHDRINERRLTIERMYVCPASAQVFSFPVAYRSFPFGAYLSI